ncbi:ATP-binding protein [Melittangium boletus]|uniref:sensor histidine kinase n=1 Tax=Melittangium boletus TaxID=83453 RepID=UPI003DA29EF2
MRSYRIAVLLGVALAALGPAASWGAEPPGRVNFRSYGAEAGIQNQDITWLTQDAEGFVWACAADGVYRFDGARFDRFGKESGLPSMGVADATLDEKGRLVLVTRAGVVRWDGGRFVAQSLEGVGGGVGTLRVDSRGRRWVGGEQGLFMEGADGRFVPAPGWPGGPVYGMWMDPSDALQVMGDKRLLSREPEGTWTVFDVPGTPHAASSALARDGQGRLWVGGLGWLAMQPWPGAALEDRTALLKGMSGAGNRLRVGRRGQLMVPNNNGLLEVEGERAGLRRLGLPERIARMWDVLEDRQDTLWVASMGVNRALGRGLWTVHDVSTGLPASMTWGSLRDRAGTLWVGTDKGLSHGTATKWEPVPGLADYAIKALAEAEDGSLWVAGTPSGLHHYTPRTGALRTFGEESGYFARYTFKLLRARDGTLWAATTSGLLHGVPRPGGAWSFEPAMPELARGSVVGLEEDARGRIWTTGTGLFVREPGGFRRMGKEHGLLDDHVRHLLLRRDGRLCVSYREPLGVSCFAYQEGGQLTGMSHLSRSTGLHNDVIYQLGEDAAGRLWVGTGAGVMLVGDTGPLEHFDSTDGAPGDDFSGNAFMAEPDGTVWVGTSNGLGRFEGARYTGAPPPPRVVLLETHLGPRTFPRPPAHGLETGSDDTGLEVHFADLGAIDEGALEHQARLEGLDTWHPVPGRWVQYSGLPPGAYRFEMRARHGRGEWGAVVGFPLRVLPPWWATWWALGLWGVLLGVAGAGVVRWRSVALRRRNTELERLVEARTVELAREREKVAHAEKLSAMGQLMARLSHEINNPLTAIHNNLPPVREYFEQQAEALARCRAVLSERPEGAEEVARWWKELDLDFVLKDTPEALEAMRFATERIRSIQADLRAFLRGERPRLERGDINRTVNDTVEFVRRSLPPGTRVDVWCGEVPSVPFHAGQLGQVLLNLLRNALDAVGEGGAVRVSTQVREGRVELVVADDGPGIPPELRSRIFEPFFTTKDVGQGSGLGLAICRQIIAENHGGTLELDESVPRGACFRVGIPLD